MLVGRFKLTSVASVYLVSCTASAMDCNKASTLREKLVCREIVLKRADDRLNWIYSMLEQALPTTSTDKTLSDLKNEQKKWIREADAKLCNNPAACETAYEKRIGSLIEVGKKNTTAFFVDQSTDWNKDGNPDLTIATSRGAKGLDYTVFVFDKTSSKYIPTGISGEANILFARSTPGIVFSHAAGGRAGMYYIDRYFKWDGTRFLLVYEEVSDGISGSFTVKIRQFQDGKLVNIPSKSLVENTMERWIEAKESRFLDWAKTWNKQ